ncbi:helix-turn-helix domain-containing protein [Gelria sp. Kuro-4]|uniref:helix-turn-helix domain-containing protein n=1 Tax=Gelria sp. Kuro-4 TaxID=2796927 RepID=UPI001BEE5B3D|nr:hypothetical protein kuro4_00210 [Gelria sp. Kuro-4]
MPRFFTVAQVAEMYQLKESHVYKLINAGQLPCVRLGRFIRIPEDKLPGLENILQTAKEEK